MLQRIKWLMVVSLLLTVVGLVLVVVGLARRDGYVCEAGLAFGVASVAVSVASLHER